MRGRQLGPKLALAALAALFALFTLEALWRVHMLGEAREHADAMAQLSRNLFPADGEALELQTLLRASDDPRIRYELRPHLSGTFENASVITDSRGFRVDARAGRAAEGPTVRVLGLGDSVMFGWGVDSTDAYLSQFAKLMEDSAPQVSWQITNTAVPGYNLAMEEQTFETKGRQLEPDVVIVGWVNNDLDLPHFLRPLPSILRIDRLYFLERLLGRLEGRSGGKFSSPAIRVAGSRIEVVSPRYLEDLPSDLRELVGREAFDRSIRDLAAAAKEQDFEVIMLVYRGRVARFSPGA